ncbi:stage II sporulation protein R [Hydrogenoanaerobacterium sp.]|uniref:stage II sporulation protein R n=1 Tax=Hydrogenoanaerobacterium sp. TaxID=2953763 RepID=UPI0028994E64|nr:stage II sporulation protein R [Hydrogenoanaerobacterium sp.]
MKRWELSILIGLVLSIITGSITGFAAQCDTVRGSTIRLHILANSDSQSDQALKLMVRDAVLTEAADAFGGAETKERAVKLARENLGEITAVAEKTLRANGCNDKVTAQVVNMFFTTRQYGSVMMPAGRYDAVRILIGEGAGRNWWCVMFPPMCLPAAEKKQRSEMSAAEQILISAEPEYELKFAVVEAYEKLKDKWEKKQEEKKIEEEKQTVTHVKAQISR